MQEFIYPNMIVRVYYPDITKEEHDRRMKQVYKAAENVLKAKERNNSSEDLCSNKGLL